MFLIFRVVLFDHSFFFFFWQMNVHWNLISGQLDQRYVFGTFMSGNVEVNPDESEQYKIVDF